MSDVLPVSETLRVRRAKQVPDRRYAPPMNQAAGATLPIKTGQRFGETQSAQTSDQEHPEPSAWFMGWRSQTGTCFTRRARSA
ncbi:MAG: hypothetical protein AAF296_10385 [Pseudomonadota bacterium]